MNIMLLIYYSGVFRRSKDARDAYFVVDAKKSMYLVGCPSQIMYKNVK